MIHKLKLLKKDTIANGTMAFSWEKPLGFDFMAGQYGDIKLIAPPETDAEGNIRSLSLASAPYEDYLVTATRMRDSAFKRVIKDMPIGSQMELDAPHGDFTLHKSVTTPAVFVIGGIGVTPVRSIVAQATHDRLPHRITLLYSNKTLADAAFMADFEQFTAENRNFDFIPVMTNVTAGEWKGETGYIDEAMLKKYVPDLSSPIFYLSGPPAMVKAMRQIVIASGANEDNIRTEEFAGY